MRKWENKSQKAIAILPLLKWGVLHVRREVRGSGTIKEVVARLISLIGSNKAFNWRVNVESLKRPSKYLTLIRWLAETGTQNIGNKSFVWVRIKLVDPCSRIWEQIAQIKERNKLLFFAGGSPAFEVALRPKKSLLDSRFDFSPSTLPSVSPHSPVWRSWSVWSLTAAWVPSSEFIIPFFSRFSAIPLFFRHKETVRQLCKRRVPIFGERLRFSLKKEK